MMDDSKADDRLQRLETQVAHQERAIEDLSRAATALWQQLEDTKRHLTRLESRLGTAEGALGEILPPELPPPHY